MFSTDLITKREAAEIAFRPQPMPEEMLSTLVDQLASLDDERFLAAFSQSTGLRLVPFTQGFYRIKY